MAILDCLCLDGVAGAEEMCEEHRRNGGRSLCYFRFRCDRCKTLLDFGESEQDRDAWLERREGFLAQCGKFAHCHKTTYRSTMLQDEFSGHFCDECMVSLLKWATVMADLLYLKSEVNRLYRSILDVKKDRNNRAVA